MVTEAANIKHSCGFAGCDLPRHSRSLCVGHYAQQHRGKPLAPLRGKTHENPLKGHSVGHVTKGYRIVKRPGHPNARRDGMIFEHRLAMAEALGRPLGPGEEVHHLNGDRLDNRLENLELWSRSQPPGQRIEDKIEWAVGVLALYRPEMLSATAGAVCQTSEGVMTYR